MSRHASSRYCIDAAVMMLRIRKVHPFIARVPIKTSAFNAYSEGQLRALVVNNKTHLFLDLLRVPGRELKGPNTPPTSIRPLPSKKLFKVARLSRTVPKEENSSLSVSTLRHSQTRLSSFSLRWGVSTSRGIGSRAPGSLTPSHPWRDRA